MPRTSQALLPSNGGGFNRDRRVSRLSAGITGNFIDTVSPTESPVPVRRVPNGLNVGSGEKSPMEKRIRRSADKSSKSKNRKSFGTADSLLSNVSEGSNGGVKPQKRRSQQARNSQEQLGRRASGGAAASRNNNNTSWTSSGPSKSTLSGRSTRKINLKDEAKSAILDILNDEINAQKTASSEVDVLTGGAEFLAQSEGPVVWKRSLTADERIDFTAVAKRISENDAELVSLLIRSTGQNVVSTSVSSQGTTEDAVTLVMPLHLTGNKFDELEMSLSTNTTIHTIDLKANDVNDDNVKALCRGLKNNESLTNLNLAKNRVTVNSIDMLNKIIVSNLVTLNLSYNNVGDSGAQKLSTGIVNSKSLKYLFLDSAAIKHYGASFLASAFAVNRSLVTVNLSGNLISQSSKRIAFAMMRNPSLQNVLVGDSHLDSIGAEHFSRLMESSVSLENIDLFGNTITDEGCLTIANALTVNRSIKRICLKRNLIGDEGISALSSSLVANHVLEVLDVGGNLIGDMGLKKMATALIVGCALKVFDISDCRITSESVNVMSDVLKNNEKLLVLDMSENNIGPDCLEYLKMAMNLNDTLQAFYIGVEGLGKEGVDELMQDDNFWETRICVV